MTIIMKQNLVVKIYFLTTGIVNFLATLDIIVTSGSTINQVLIKAVIHVLKKIAISRQCPFLPKQVNTKEIVNGIKKWGKH